MGDQLTVKTVTSARATAAADNVQPQRPNLLTPFTAAEANEARATLAHGPHISFSVGIGVVPYAPVAPIYPGWSSITVMPAVPLADACVVSDAYGRLYNVPCAGGVIPTLQPGFTLRMRPARREFYAPSMFGPYHHMHGWDRRGRW